MKKISCNHCGKCCIIFNPNKKKWIICPYRDVETKRCRIYKTRLGRYIGYGFVCTERKNTIFDFPDCPYNTSKPLHPAFRDYDKPQPEVYCMGRRLY